MRASLVSIKTEQEEFNKYKYTAILGGRREFTYPYMGTN